MKKNFCFIIIFTYLFCVDHVDYKAFLVLKKPKKDERYYNLLPTVKKSGDLNFIRSREPESMSLEKKYLQMLHKATAATVFIETGTCKGDTTAKAADIFQEVYSIELDKALYNKAQTRFANINNISLLCGDSSQLLAGIIEEIPDKKIIVFLDAHYSMGVTAKGESNTPIMQELEQIKKTYRTDLIIVIDDIRMFYQPTAKAVGTFVENYPTINKIVEKLLDINPDYQCAVIYDTLVAFNAQEKITVSNTVHALTMSRLYNNENYLIDDILQAELDIAQSSGKEQEAILDLANRWIEPWSKPFGLSIHCALWAGLILCNNEQYANALKLFQETQARGMRDWRLDWYSSMAQAEIFFDIR